MKMKFLAGCFVIFLTVTLMAIIYQIQEAKITEEKLRRNTLDLNYKQVTLCRNLSSTRLYNMKAVKVQYTVRQEFAETNAANIRQVMADLRKLDGNMIRYSSFVMSDKVSFVHFVITTDDGAKVLSNLQSFKKFQGELEASQPEIPPKVEQLTLVGSSYDFFIK